MLTSRTDETHIGLHWQTLKVPTLVGGDWKWGSGLNSLTTDCIIDATGYQLIHLYQLLGPMLVIMQLVLHFLVGLVRMLLNILVCAASGQSPLGHHHPDCNAAHTLGDGEEAGGLRMV
jgi:hypothetical protein